MLLQSLAQPVAYVGAALGVAMVIPQLARTVRHPNLPGVSAMSWGLLALGSLMWFAYGIRTTAIPQLPGNVFLASGAVAVVMLVPSVLSRRKRAQAMGSAASVLVALAIVLPPQNVGYVAFSISLCSAWPQLIESFSNWRSGVVSGVSLTMMSVRLTSILCWISYAVLASDRPVIISATFGLMSTLAVLGMEASLRLGQERAILAAPELELERA